MENPLQQILSSDPFSTWIPFVLAIAVGFITVIRSYFGGPDCPSNATITGKTVVITGGSSGIGLQVVLELLKRGGRVIVGSRNPETAVKEINQAIRTKKLASSLNSQFVVKHLDLTSFMSVKDFVKTLDNEPKIDILINNAGMAFGDFRKTEEGFETHLVTNYLSHFLLTHLLLPKLKASDSARIINVSAQAHYVGEIFLDDMNLENDYHYNKAFGQSKLALVLMAKQMAKFLEGTNITINAMHPGLVRNTKQFKNWKIFSSLYGKIAMSPWVWLFMKSPEQGAQTIIYMAVATELKNTSGEYFSNCKIVKPSEKAFDESLCEELYEKSLEFTQLLKVPHLLEKEHEKNLRIKNHKNDNLM